MSSKKSYSELKKYHDKYRNSENGKQKVREAKKRYHQTERYKELQRKKYAEKKKIRRRLKHVLKGYISCCNTFNDVYLEEENYLILLKTTILALHLFFSTYHYSSFVRTHLTYKELNALDEKNYLNIGSFTYVLNKNEKQKIVPLYKKVLLTNILRKYLLHHSLFNSDEMVLITDIPLLVNHDKTKLSGEETRLIILSFYKNAKTKGKSVLRF
jgi:hypothetical protein